MPSSFEEILLTLFREAGNFREGTKDSNNADVLSWQSFKKAHEQLKAKESRRA